MQEGMKPASNLLTQLLPDCLASPSAPYYYFLQKVARSSLLVSHGSSLSITLLVVFVVVEGLKSSVVHPSHTHPHR
jgi:hypothetical protein